MNLFDWLIVSALLDDDKRKTDRPMTKGEEEFWTFIGSMFLAVLFLYGAVIVAAMAGWEPR